MEISDFGLDFFCLTMHDWAMCGRMNVTDSPFVRELMEGLGMSVYPQPKRNIAPGSTTAILLQTVAGRQLEEAYWSLLIEPRPGKPGYRPNPKWATFNSKSTRLESSRLWSSAFKSQRAIIPASCFFEWKDKVCHAIAPVDKAIAFAGLYRSWEFDGETVYSFSVITLPKQPAFSHIHEKSYPLMLEEGEYERWLDPGFKKVEAFADLLNSGIRRDISVIPVDSPNTMEVCGDTEIISRQAA